MEQVLIQSENRDIVNASLYFYVLERSDERADTRIKEKVTLPGMKMYRPLSLVGRQEKLEFGKISMFLK